MRRLTLAFVLLLAACSSPSETTDVAPSTPAAAAATPAPPPPPKLETAAVQGVLDAWLAAQNGGDFDAYSATYAGKFFGIKRSGPREYRFERDGWLADRKRMFRKPFKVEAGNVVIKPASTSATVQFIQTWASGTYEDVGPKQLVVVKEGGALRIAREEMLQSKILHDATQSDGEVVELGWVEQLDGKNTWVLVDDEMAEWDGTPVLMAESPATAGVRVADSAAGGKVGSAITLHGPDGACPGRLVEPTVVSRFHPHWGQMEFWEQENVSDAAKADEIMGMGPTQLWMKFVPSEGSCSGEWAVDTGMPGPLVYSEDSALAARVGGKAVEAFKQQEGFEAVQREFEESDLSGRWEEYDGASIAVTGYSHPSGAAAVIVSATSGYGCGDWEGTWWSVWAVDGDNLRLLTDAKETPIWVWSFDSVLDVDRDGTPELELDGKVVDAKGETLIDATVPSFDCPC